MFSFIDRLLNDVTMYRLVLYVLGGISAAGIFLAFLGKVPGSGWGLLGSLVCLVFTCYLSNALFARMLGAATNAESSAITGLILFLILFPAERIADYASLVLVAIAAMGSKYILTMYRRHVFNPAAFGAVIAGLVGWGASWWIGSPWMLPAVAVGGLLIVRKTRRGQLFATFLAAAMVSVVVTGRWSGTEAGVLELLSEAFVSWPVVFFGAVMLTEPLTLPASKNWQLAEAALVGLLFAVPYHLGPLYSTPELALLIGNVFACADGFNRLYRLRLEEKNEIAPGVFEFVFSSDAKPLFSPGQYFEWTLPHGKPDARGNRRTFTVASSPQETHVRFGIRMPHEPSSFKRALSELKIGDVLFASNVGGEFTLPSNPKQKLTFIAGGIGVTPFRSMVQHLVHRKEKRDVMLFYACKNPSDFAYKDVFDRASETGLRCLYMATERDGRLTKEMIKKEASDYLERHYYLSGPPAMVASYKDML